MQIKPDSDADAAGSEGDDDYKDNVSYGNGSGGDDGSNGGEIFKIAV